MNIPNPRNASEALTQARVNERSQRLFEDGYRAEYLPADDVIVITSDEGNVYRVSTIFEDCTCPFYAERDYCKHAIGAQRLLLLSNNERQEMAEAAELEMSVDLYRKYKNNDPFADE